jgi:hypothetical protein
MNLIRFSSGRVLNADQIVTVKPYPATDESPAYIDVFTTDGFYMPPFKGAEADELQAFLKYNTTDIVGEWSSTKANPRYWQNGETFRVLSSEVRPGDMWEEIDAETFLVFGGTL